MILAKTFGVIDNFIINLYVNCTYSIKQNHIASIQTRPCAEICYYSGTKTFRRCIKGQAKYVIHYQALAAPYKKLVPAPRAFLDMRSGST